MQVFKRWGFAGLTLVLAAGWSYREVAFARERAEQVKSGNDQPRSGPDGLIHR